MYTKANTINTMFGIWNLLSVATRTKIIYIIEKITIKKSEDCVIHAFFIIYIKTTIYIKKAFKTIKKPRKDNFESRIECH